MADAVLPSADDPVAFFTSQHFKSRSSDLSRLLDSVGLAVNSLQAADNGISFIIKLVKSAQATVRQALQSKTTAAVVIGTEQLALTDALDTLDFVDGDEIEVNGTPIVVGTAATYSVKDLLDDLNALPAIRASLANGVLRIEDLFGNDIVLGEGGQGANNLPGLGLVAGTTEGSLSVARQGFAQEYNRILTQVPELVQDSGFNGVNLLNGDTIQVIFSTDASSTLNIIGVTFDAAGLGLTAAENDFQDNASVQQALEQLDQAVASLISQASTFAANLSLVEVRQGFTKSLISTLEAGTANHTVAGTKEEGANMLALQTRQQLSSVALSLAAQADQNVLRLF